MYAFPILTAESGCTYNTGSPNTITLSGTAATNYFTVAQAVADGDGGAVDGMTVICTARKSDADVLEWVATYDATGGTLSEVTVIRSEGTISNGDTVTVDIHGPSGAMLKEQWQVRLGWGTASSADTNQTLVVGEILPWDISGLTADRDVLMPASPASGDRCGVYITTGDDAFEGIVKLDGSTEASRVYLTGDKQVYRYTGSAWVIEDDVRKPRFAVRKNDQSGTNQSIPTGAWTKIIDEMLGTSEKDAGSLWDGTNNRYTAREPGTYNTTGLAVYESLTSGDVWIVGIYKNGALACILARGIAGGSGVAGGSGSKLIVLAAGDYVELYTYHNASGAETLANSAASAGYCYFSVERAGD